MKEIVRPNIYKVPLLVEQLFAAFPEWKALAKDGKYMTEVQISHTATEIWFLVPDDTNEERFQGVLAAHNPADKTTSEAAEEKRQVDRASGQGKLKAAGLTDDELKALFG